MGFSDEKAQNAKSDSLLHESGHAIDTASKPNAATQEMEDYWKSIVDWDTGKSGPVDVRNLPGSQADIDLFTKAKSNEDAGRVGRGSGTMGDNVNPSFMAALDRELANQREIEASGTLENVVQGKVSEARANLTGIGAQEQNASLQAAGLRNQLFGTYLNRPLQKGWGTGLISGGLAAAGELGQGALEAGGWSGLFAM